MARPRPLRRLIDGSPDASGRSIARRWAQLMTVAMLVANGIVVAAFVLPTPDNVDRGSRT